MYPSHSFMMINIFSCLEKPFHYRIMHLTERRTLYKTLPANTDGGSEVSKGPGTEGTTFPLCSRWLLPAKP